MVNPRSYTHFIERRFLQSRLASLLKKALGKTPRRPQHGLHAPNPCSSFLPWRFKNFKIRTKTPHRILILLNLKNVSPAWIRTTNPRWMEVFPGRKSSFILRHVRQRISGDQPPPSAPLARPSNPIGKARTAWPRCKRSARRRDSYGSCKPWSSSRIALPDGWQAGRGSELFVKLAR